MTSPPTWLRQHLEATGRANNDGVARTITVGLCPRCRAQVVRGLDGDRLGLPVVCDPTPLDQLGEAIALITDRHTYDLTGPARRPSLDPRRPAHIAKTRRYPVLADHACGRPLPAAPDTAPLEAPSAEVPF